MAHKHTHCYLLSVLWMVYRATEGGVGSTSSALASASLKSLILANWAPGVTLAGRTGSLLEVMEEEAEASTKPDAEREGLLIYTK